MIKVGIGEDSHRFVEPENPAHADQKHKPLVMAGVRIESKDKSGVIPGLLAHSDGDVIYHAVFNAISTAMGGRSIGYHFPDTDPKYKNRDSSEFFTVLQEALAKSGHEIAHLCVHIEAKRPKLEPHHDAMKANLCRQFGLRTDQVALAFTTGEGLTEFGNGKGIRVIANATLLDRKAFDSIVAESVRRHLARG